MSIDAQIHQENTDQQWQATLAAAEAHRIQVDGLSTGSDAEKKSGALAKPGET